MKYCESIFETRRRPTRCVMVGSVGVGGDNPIRIQSMTSSSTRDIEATIEQSVRLADAGCEIIRVTVQGIKEAEACEGIKNGLIKRGYTVPLVADIHFYPPAAMKAADFVDKVRINPGNFVDKRASFKIIEYDDESYAKELEKIEEKFSPLVHKCKQLKRAMRIGTNHGSLSDRIMNRFGDTPRGMVESALEFAHICRKYDYHDFMFSMKSSNPQVMILAYRLLVAEMYALGWDYPLHLGVTEAGEGEDGRIKSSVGIGSLLLDGIGDTIRVSLTEDPWLEINPCQRLVDLAHQAQGKGVAPFAEEHRPIENIQRRSVNFPAKVPMHKEGTVVLTVTENELLQPDFYTRIGCDTVLGRPKLKISSVDMLAIKEKLSKPESLEIVKRLQDVGVGILSPDRTLAGAIPLLTLQQAQEHLRNTLFDTGFKEPTPVALIIGDEQVFEWDAIRRINPSFLFLKTEASRLHKARALFEWLHNHQMTLPVLFHFTYSSTLEEAIIQASAECGALFCDGLGDGLWLEGSYAISELRSLSFNLLQACRMRTSKTDFISCPSCGRTLFDLQDVTKRIRSRTAHLPGVKIAIMGCIVNGPGEMADADFGYVGSKPGKIDLYVGKNCIKKDIDFTDADDQLVELIKTHGRWKEPNEE